MTDYKSSRRRIERKHETIYAASVCLMLFLAMGFAGWYENHTPVPQPTLEQMVRLCDQHLEGKRK